MPEASYLNTISINGADPNWINIEGPNEIVLGMIGGASAAKLKKRKKNAELMAAFEISKRRRRPVIEPEPTQEILEPIYHEPVFSRFTQGDENWFPQIKAQPQFAPGQFTQTLRQQMPQQPRRQPIDQNEQAIKLLIELM